MSTDFRVRLEVLRQSVDATLEERLPAATEPPARLHEAMRYSVFAGGKRVRPALSLLCARAEALHRAESAADAERRALGVAAALEMIHTYSLIHDDLPCMDDDDMRRGKPTCHRVFGEAIAVLAGDALNTLAFEIAARSAADRGGDVVMLLASCTGTKGMVGGQVDDLQAMEVKGDATLLESIHRRKTAMLFAASTGAGAIVGGARGARLANWRELGMEIGLAFQIVDDILDVTATSNQMGKATGKDANAGKLTYPALFGLQRARELALLALKRASRMLNDTGDPEGDLAAFIAYLGQRSS